MKGLGIALVTLGLIGLVVGGFSYTRQKKVIDVGPLQASVTEKERVPVPPLAGGLVMAAGLVLIVAGGRRRATD